MTNPFEQLRSLVLVGLSLALLSQPHPQVSASSSDSILMSLLKFLASGALGQESQRLFGEHAES